MNYKLLFLLPLLGCSVATEDEKTRKLEARLMIVELQCKEIDELNIKVKNLQIKINELEELLKVIDTKTPDNFEQPVE